VVLTAAALAWLALGRRRPRTAEGQAPISS
jgi:hypothetical protein